MKHSRNPLYQAVQYALVPGAVAGFALASSPVMAQDADDDSAQLDRVQVTGSRISRVDIEGANPVTILDRDDIQRTGVVDIGELIQELPSITGSPVSTQRNNGGNGSVAADIRGMGTVRTLVLVNGKRVSALGNDLSTIPTAMVERVEVLKDGASAIYGADAVAGVINIITRSDYEGATLELQYGESFDLDGTTSLASFITGGSSDRGNFVIGMQYTSQDEIFAGAYDTEYVANAVAVYDFDAFYANGYVPFNSDVDGDGVLDIVSLGSSRIPYGRFNVPSLGTVTICQGNTGENAGDYGSLGGTCGPATYNFAPVNYVQTPWERASMFFQGEYELFDNISAYMFGNFTNRESEQLLAPLPYDTRFDPSYANDPASGGAVISADNIYNPFGEDITEWRRRMVETGGRSFNQEINAAMFVFGVTGDLGATWSWDVSYNYGERNRTDTDFGQFYGPNLARALGPSFVDGSGVPTCGTPSNPIAGCVPFNPFTNPDSNPIQQDQLDYVSIPLNDRFDTTRQVFNATMVGDLFELPAGPVGVAFGYEYRDEDYRFVPDSAKTADETTGNTGAGTDGEYDVDSFFAELNIPILADIPGFNLLELTLAGRYDDFSNFGSTENFMAGVRWQPFRGLLIRGTYNEVFREPNVSELFAGQGDSFPNASDPCNTTNWSTLTADGQARCIAQGVPNGGYVQTDVQVRARVGGNPNLGPEEGEVTTVGFAWAPEFVNGLSFTVDWWEIELDNAIQSLGASTVLDECIRNGNLATCGNITRLAGGNLDQVLTLQQNIAFESAEGWDFSANYNWNSDWGLFNFRWLATYLDSRQQIVPGAVPLEVAGLYEKRGAFSGSSNEGAFPEWKMNFVTDWALGDFEVSLNVEYIDSLEMCGDNNFGLVSCPEDLLAIGQQPGPLDIYHTIDSVTYWDLSGAYTFGDWGTRIQVGINNLTDEELPYIHDAFNNSTDPDTYRAFGRTWFVNLRQDF